MRKNSGAHPVPTTALASQIALGDCHPCLRSLCPQGRGQRLLTAPSWKLCSGASDPGFTPFGEGLGDRNLPTLCSAYAATPRFSSS